MLNIVIVDPKDLLTKTQRKKIRKLVAEKWDDTMEAAFTEELDAILEQIHYEDEKVRYNVCKFDYTKHNECLTLNFDCIHIQTKEERRNELKKKLHDKLKSKHNIASADPSWKIYEQLRSRMPESQRAMIPDPDQVRANMPMYRTMMTMIPNQNPLYEYLSLLVPPEET